MSDYVIIRGNAAKLGKVESSLKVGNNARIEALEGNLVIVEGDAIFQGAAVLNCDFNCDSIQARRGGILRVRGNLVVHKKIDLDNTLQVDGTISAQEIDVGGKVFAKKIECKKIRVGGTVDSETLIAEQVDVGGKISVQGNVQVIDLGVGGRVTVGGGSISGNIRVGGNFQSREDLEFGDLQSFGRAEFLSEARGRKISTSGKVIAARDFQCQEIEVNGVTSIRGNCVTNKIIVNGKLMVDGNLSAVDVIEIYGTGIFQNRVISNDLRLGGRLRAPTVGISGTADIAGSLETTEGLRANLIRVTGGSRCTGPLLGDRIEIGKSKIIVANWNKKWFGQTIALRLVGRMTRVEDVYGKEVFLGSSSQSRKVYGEIVEVGKCAVAEQVTYTKELKGSASSGRFSKPPQKVSRLPEHTF